MAWTEDKFANYSSLIYALVRVYQHYGGCRFVLHIVFICIWLTFSGKVRV